MKRIIFCSLSFSFCLYLVGCCTLGGGKVDCSYFISLATPRQTASRFKCALLYDQQGSETAYNCLSKNTQEKIPFWKFKYGFHLIDYDKNKELKLWEILSALQVEAVEEIDTTHALLICVVAKKFAKKHQKSYSEFIYLLKEGDDWKLDLVKTLTDRGSLDDLDKWEKGNPEKT